ncbi:MAG: amidohydrolase family protein [Myxococcota bacterium]|jgi:predicted TIM-barrel fold metal-dependent hydrolase|nr:amidohydrolase [Deltaproteobacteria bacterium]MCP4242231.1 amidohydrolase family protein [bacterium]MDP6244007.1 amidohydrolase family protein [Myxococcota bacterium]MDP7074395.1 amidohydrolase family protein [Myxococcota bacterium]MDP7300549.1 amidohydrolase family protein [Myxococcota bacterium]
MSTPKIQDWVIDTDTHISEPGDLWTSRLPARFKESAPQIVRDPKTGVETWQIGNMNTLMPVGFTAVAGWPDPFPAAPKNMDEVPKAAYDATARLEHMDRVGIWAAALYPNVGGFGSQAFLNLKDPELMLACVRAYNDFVIDWISPNPQRFIPILATPFWDVEASAAEIERCAKIGHKGVLFTGEPQSHGMPILASRHWDPLWEAARACDLPVSFHIGTGTFDDGFTPERIKTTGVGRTNGFAAVSLFLDNGKQLTDLLFSGILPRYPELKFLSVEAGIGFIPFILEACDYTFVYGQVREANPEFVLKPSEYFARQVYGCYIFEEHAPRELMDSIGEDNILFETDYPHPVSLYGNVRKKIDAALGKATPQARRKVLFENAAKLYKVDAPDVAPPVPVG